MGSQHERLVGDVEREAAHDWLAASGPDICCRQAADPDLGQVVTAYSWHRGPAFESPPGPHVLQRAASWRRSMLEVYDGKSMPGKYMHVTCLGQPAALSRVGVPVSPPGRGAAPQAVVSENCEGLHRACGRAESPLRLPPPKRAQGQVWKCVRGRTPRSSDPSSPKYTGIHEIHALAHMHSRLQAHAHE